MSGSMWVLPVGLLILRRIFHAGGVAISGSCHTTGCGADSVDRSENGSLNGDHQSDPKDCFGVVGQICQKLTATFVW